MKYHESIIYEPTCDISLPMPQLSTMDCECPRCKNTYRIPVPLEYMDWENVAMDYRRTLKKWDKVVNELFEEAGEVFDVPLKEWIDAKNAHMVMVLRDLVEKLNETDDA